MNKHRKRNVLNRCPCCRWNDPPYATYKKYRQAKFGERPKGKRG